MALHERLEHVACLLLHPCSFRAICFKWQRSYRIDASKLPDRPSQRKSFHVALALPSKQQGRFQRRPCGLIVFYRNQDSFHCSRTVQKEIFKDELGDQETLALRAKETREAAYTNAVIIEGLIMAQLALAQKDPTQAFKAGSALKALSLAASALERLHGTKLRALGLDKESVMPTEPPELIIRDLSKEELQAFRERDEADDESDIGIPIVPAGSESGLVSTEIDDSDDIIEEGREVEDEDIVVEGGEPDEPTEPRPTSLDIHGGRLVKEAQP